MSALAEPQSLGLCARGSILNEKVSPILLIEENRADAYRIAEYLEAPRFLLTHVDSLAAGLAHLRSHHADAVLLDSGLPVSDGEATFRRLRVAMNGGHPPTIILTRTTHEDEALAQRLVASGAQDCLPKALLGGMLLQRAVRHAIERAEIESSLAKAKRDLAQTRKMTRVATLASGLAHQLKHPLTRILLNTGLLSEAGLDESQLELLHRIAKSVQQADDMVRTLLDFARNHSHQPKAVPMQRCFHAAFDQFDGQQRSRLIECSFSGDLPHVFADVDSVSQVFLNLLHNAVHAVREKTRPVIAVHGTYSPDGYVIAEIRDNGTGIPAEDLDRVFEPFVSSKCREEGNGLGLAYVKEVISLHDGYVSIRNRRAGGVAVQVALPVASRDTSL